MGARVPPRIQLRLDAEVVVANGGGSVAHQVGAHRMKLGRVLAHSRRQAVPSHISDEAVVCARQLGAPHEREPNLLETETRSVACETKDNRVLLLKRGTYKARERLDGALLASQFTQGVAYRVARM
jgi:hypothetical protein